MKIRFLFLFSVSLVYTCVRYMLLGEVAPDHLPAFLFNKALSMMAVMCILLTALSFVNKQDQSLKFWGTASLHLVYIHIFTSLALLSESYYPKLFSDRKLDLAGELVVLSGVLATYCYYRIAGANAITRKYLQLIGSILVAVHLIAMGFNGWMQPEKWLGGLPPISLVSFCIVVFACTYFVRMFKGRCDMAEQRAKMNRLR